MSYALVPSTAAILLAGCSDPIRPGSDEAEGAPAHGLAAVTLALDTIESALSDPVFVTSTGRDARLFIVEKDGRILVRTPAGLRAQPFLDLRGQVSTNNEQGLLGLAFHPEYETNGRFFVNYTDVNGDTRIEEYRRAGRHIADPASARLVLGYDQPAANHNGGMMAFGRDGYLYISSGDGGTGNRANGQRLNTLLGKILRIDVDGALPYAVPADNPFVGQDSARGEIWHYGLRNPWRFSFDRGNGRMYIGDVGNQTYEEIDVVHGFQRGLNFGWAVMEGPACFLATTCDSAGMRRPQYWYTHADGCAVTGGYVYRGRAMPELRGTYFFADFCSGVIWSFRRPRTQILEFTDRSGELGILNQLTSFGEDWHGELYAVTRTGYLVKLVPGV